MVKRVLFVVGLVMCMASVSVVQAGEATDQLRQSIDEIVGLLKDPQLKSSKMKVERRNRIFKVVETRFDFAEMARRSLAEHWQNLSDGEQKEFEVSFSRLLENSYITKVEKYSDEEVNYRAERAKGSRYMLVSTDVVSGGQSIPLEYSMHNVGGRWMVYDVNIEGVSLVTNYRSQFRELMRKEGFKGLMNKLNEKVKDIEEG